MGISKKTLYDNAVREDLDDASKVAGKILNYCRKSLIGDTAWENVVITVPASFQYAQRQDVLHAAQYAHIDVHDGMLFDEPTSAFLGYFNQLSIEEKQRIPQDGTCKILVVDFGGGTIDLSTIAVRRENALSIGIDNVAISRYNNLGGQDLDMIFTSQSKTNATPVSPFRLATLPYRKLINAQNGGPDFIKLTDTNPVFPSILI